MGTGVNARLIKRGTWGDVIRSVVGDCGRKSMKKRGGPAYLGE
jgi:hypothetical protein